MVINAYAVVLLAKWYNNPGSCTRGLASEVGPGCKMVFAIIGIGRSLVRNVCIRNSIRIPFCKIKLDQH